MASNMVYKKYLNLKSNGKNATHLKIELYYSLGGYNYFTYKQEGRGYYLSVVPVERANGFEGFMAFSGIKQLVKPVARKSEKAAREAEKLAEGWEERLIAYVLSDQGLELEEVA